eukprot:tig00020554_g10813.t1
MAAAEKVPLDKVQCRRVLEKSPQDRTFQEILIILELLEGVRAFQNIPRDQKAELCRQVKYQKYPAGATVFSQGDVGSAFFIVFSGFLDVLVTNDKGITSTVSHLTEGATFGEVALTQTTTRTASIIAKNDTELLAIEKRDYDAILKSPLAHELKEKLEFLRRVPVFQHWLEIPPPRRGLASASRLFSELAWFRRAQSAMELHSLTYVMNLRTYPRNAVIIREGEDADAIFFVKSGELAIIKRLAISTGRSTPDSRAPEFPDPWEVPRPGEPGYKDPTAGRRAPVETPLAAPRSLEARRAQAVLHAGAPRGRRLATARQRMEALVRDTGARPFAAPEGPAPVSLPPLPLSTLPSSSPARRPLEPLSARVEPSAPQEPLPAGSQTSRPHASSDALHSSHGAHHKKRQPGAHPPSAPKEVRFVEIGCLAAYDCFGEVGILQKAQRSTTIIARSPVEVYVMTKWDFLRRASKQILNAMRAGISKYPGDEELISAFYEDQHWRVFKRDLIAQIQLERKASRPPGQSHT